MRNDVRIYGVNVQGGGFRLYASLEHSEQDYYDVSAQGGSKREVFEMLYNKARWAALNYAAIMLAIEERWEEGE